MSDTTALAMIVPEVEVVKWIVVAALYALGFAILRWGR